MNKHRPNHDRDQNFRVNTKTFLRVWRENSAPERDWRSFILQLFREVEGDNRGFTGSYKGYRAWNPDQTNRTMKIGGETSRANMVTEEERYQFLSERAYAKGMSLRKRMIRANPGLKGQISLPTGYKDRTGDTSGRRSSLTGEEMIKLLLG